MQRRMTRHLSPGPTGGRVFGRMATVQFGLPREGTMATAAPDVDLLHRRILATSAALHGARAAYEHSPTADNEHAIATAIRRLDELLDKLPRTETP